MNANSTHNVIKPEFILAFCLKFFSSTTFTMLNFALSSYVVFAFGLGAIETGLAVGAFTVGSMLIRPFAGWITTKANPKSVLFAACSLFALTTATCGTCSSLFALICARVVQGLAFGVIHNTVIVVVNNVLPHQKLGVGMGIFAISTSLSTATGSYIGITIGLNAQTLLFPIASICAFVSAAMAFALLLIRGKPIAKSTTKPNNNSNSGRIKIADLFDKDALPCGFVSLLACAAYVSISVFLGDYSLSVGLSDVSAWYFAAYPIVLVILRLVMGKIIDAGKGKVLGIFTLTCLGVGLITLAFSRKVLLFFFSAVMIIIGYGGTFFVMQTTAIRQAKSERVGVAASTFGLMSDLGLALAPGISGALQLSVGFSGMYAIYASVILIAALVSFVSAKTSMKLSTLNLDRQKDLP